MKLLLPQLGLVAAVLFAAGSPALAGEAERVSREHSGNAMNPVWSPDGSRITYELVHAQEKYTEIFMVELDSGTEEEVRPPVSAGSLGGRFGSQRQVNHEFAWSPTGQLYAFSSSGSDDEFDLYLKGVSIPIGTETKEGGPAFSADGRHIAYCSAVSGDGDLYLLDIYSLEAPPTRLTRGEGLEFYATWAPSGDSLAYTSLSEQGSNIEVIDNVHEPEASRRTVTQWKSNQLKPSWSPDGRWIAFYSNHDNTDRTSFDIYVVQAAGGDPFKVAADVLPSERSGPAWTPDSRAIISVRNAPNEGDPIVRFDLGSGTAVPIATGTVNNANPVVFGRSGDSTWRVAFVSQGVRSSETQGWRRIWVVDVPAASRRGR